ncbi:MAG: fibronectin type III domain-containing protein, partial [Prevotella sp.]|nr:fibronectin type III domain-containing protein [Prevotella sp.]
FDAGYSEFNRVTVSNQSGQRGIVTTDAVRFGGGMGNIQRGGTISGMPRALEGARYYAQWAGMPYSVYSGRGGTDDYADDINVRSYMTNYIGGGSPFMPTVEGKRVPIELSLAIHSDAGFARDGEGLIGSLAICTTGFNDGKLNAGISRMASRDLADELLSNVTLDTKYKYGTWNRRELYDRNYSETRMPEVPSAILETMSHQNFPDMRYGQDPNFRFNMARSIYKSILRYVNDQHGTPFIVAPLAPENFRIEFRDDDEVQLHWDAVSDPQEVSSKPTSYLVYTSVGGADFDNGTPVSGKTALNVKLEPGLLYHFKVAAVNRGGKSFATEVLSALYQPKAKQTIMIVNGFHRLSSPAIRNTAEEQGFDIDEDPGITYGPTLGWAGRQINFDRKQMGIEGGGLGYSGEELTGMLIAGNDMNYVCTHAEAIQHAGQYSIVSCSSKALEKGLVDLRPYALVDMVLGLERSDGHSLQTYKTFTTGMQQALRQYTARGGALMVSGAYVGTDMAESGDSQFLASVLKCRFGGHSGSQNGAINGMGTSFSYWNTLNEQHYAATSTDILQPLQPAFTALQYTEGSDAAVAYKGSDYRAFTIGFPFECITDKQKRTAIMRGIINFLIQ